MTALRIVRPGMQTTVQDGGRWGWQRYGVPVAGPMDPRAHRLANALVDNEPEAATLEISLVGPELQFDDARTVAVAGAVFEMVVDGRPVPPNAPFVVSAGSVLRFGSRLRGARAYLGVSGGIAVPLVFGSRATHVPSAMGGLDGRPLRAGDRLALGSFGPRRRLTPAISEIVDLEPTDRAGVVRILPGPHHDRFAADALDALQTVPYVVDQRSDRMGFRLRGPRLEHAGEAEMLSDATTLGGLQVPPDGQPILLMADRQTTGGYPIVATVITADIGIAGQLAPGDAITFVLASFGEAMAALIAQERLLMAVESGGR
jgi:biotin-dependent carboxylase-like uncharacterized protein